MEKDRLSERKIEKIDRGRDIEIKLKELWRKKVTETQTEAASISLISSSGISK
jgi:hypothetical protein